MDERKVARLVKSAQRGNQEAFCELMDLKIRNIVYIATNLMGNAADGEDAAQESIIAIGQKLGQLKQAEYFETWMYRIVFNVCMGEKRNIIRKYESASDMEAFNAVVRETNEGLLPGSDMERSDENAELMEAINSLPERHRMCLLLFYFEDMSYAQIAQTLQISEQAVANLMIRAKKKLYEALLEKDEGRQLGAKAGVAAAAPLSNLDSVFDHNAEATISSGAMATAKGAAAIALPQSALQSAFVKSVLAKTAASAAVVLTVVAGGLALLFSLPADIAVDQPQAVEVPVEQPEPAIIEEETLASHVVMQPDGSTVEVVAKDGSSSAWQAFQDRMDEYTLVNEGVSEGYTYQVYQRTGAEEYVAVVEGDFSQDLEPRYLNIELP